MLALPDRILLVDHHRPLCDAWRRCFDDMEGVEVRQADYFAEPADAMVSPANSFGVMDGGLDRAIRDALGFEVQDRVQAVIRERHHGEMHVGVAEVVATDDARWPWLIVAPTMRVPSSAIGTTHAYVAFRAALLAVHRHHQGDGAPIRSMVCCGLGTGIGAMPPERCALQMRMALRQLRGSPALPSFQRIHATHEALLRG